MVFFFLMVVGGAGFIAMTFLGMAHGIGGHHSAGGGHVRLSLPHHTAGHSGNVGHSGGNIHGAHHGSATPQIAKGGNLAKAKSSSPAQMADPWSLLMAVSPIDIFAMIFGSGVSGMIFQHFLLGWQLIAAAIAGAFLFTLGLLHPLMGLLLRFASKPSEGLEGEVASLAQVITNFDGQGRGMVSLRMDEQISQILAYLEPDELGRGVSAKRGDTVVIVSVDPKRNTCMVSRELAPSAASEAFFENRSTETT